MGCDIHIAIEKKIEGQWVMIDFLRYTEYTHGKDRNYKRFAALAGVRGDGPAPLGVPKDVSLGTKFHIDIYGTDGHSHSYISMEEACKVFVETNYEPVSHPTSYFFGLEDEDIKDCRLVYFFDN